MTDKEQASVSDGAPGFLVRGFFVGYKLGRDFEFRNRPGEKGHENSKVRVRVGQGHVDIGCGDDQRVRDLVRGWAAGDLVEIEIEPVAPFGSQGPIKYRLPGTADEGWIV